MPQISQFIVKPVDAAGLIFPPGSSLTYRTPEFTFTAEINRLGFRDREFALTRGAGMRILAIGDSFIYGWAVGVGITRGDDLAQLKRESRSMSPSTGAGEQEAAAGARQGGASRLAGAVMGRLYPNFLFLLRRRAVGRQVVNVEWKSQAERVLQTLTPEERARFERLDQEVRERFLGGELNPDLLLGALKRPDYFLETLDTSRPAVRAMISSMGRALTDIKEVAAGSHAEVVVVSIPYKVYASRRDLASNRRLGLDLAPEMVTGNAAGEAIELISRLCCRNLDEM